MGEDEVFATSIYLAEISLPEPKKTLVAGEESVSLPAVFSLHQEQQFIFVFGVTKMLFHFTD